MSTDRLVRVNELVLRELSQAVLRLTSDADLDASAVTITGVTVSRDLRDARVTFSVRDGEARSRAYLHFLKSHRLELQRWIGQTCRMKYTPRLSFVYDNSLVRGDNVLAILSNLKVPETPDQPETPAATNTHPDE